MPTVGGHDDSAMSCCIVEDGEPEFELGLKEEAGEPPVDCSSRSMESNCYFCSEHFSCCIGVFPSLGERDDANNCSAVQSTGV